MELTPDQLKSLQEGNAVPVRLNGTDCIVLRKDIFDQVQRTSSYDDGDWTEEEMRALAARTFEDADRAGPIP
jgi:hypothetical protein